MSLSIHPTRTLIKLSVSVTFAALLTGCAGLPGLRLSFSEAPAAPQPVYVVATAPCQAPAHAQPPAPPRYPQQPVCQPGMPCYPRPPAYAYCQPGVNCQGAVR